MFQRGHADFCRGTVTRTRRPPRATTEQISPKTEPRLRFIGTRAAVLELPYRHGILTLFICTLWETKTKKNQLLLATQHHKTQSGHVTQHTARSKHRRVIVTNRTGCWKQIQEAEESKPLTVLGLHGDWPVKEAWWMHPEPDALPRLFNPWIHRHKRVGHAPESLSDSN